MDDGNAGSTGSLGSTVTGSAATTSDNKDTRSWKAGAKAAGQSLSQMGQSDIREAAAELAYKDPGVRSYRHGGKVRKTGIGKLHRGEVVIPAKTVRKVKKALKRATSKRGKGKRREM